MERYIVKLNDKACCLLETDCVAKDLLQFCQEIPDAIEISKHSDLSYYVTLNNNNTISVIASRPVVINRSIKKVLYCLLLEIW